MSSREAAETCAGGARVAIEQPDRAISTLLPTAGYAEGAEHSNATCSAPTSAAHTDEENASSRAYTIQGGRALGEGLEDEVLRLGEEVGSASAAAPSTLEPHLPATSAAHAPTQPSLQQRRTASSRSPASLTRIRTDTQQAPVAPAHHLQQQQQQPAQPYQPPQQPTPSTAPFQDSSLGPDPPSGMHLRVPVTTHGQAPQIIVLHTAAPDAAAASATHHADSLSGSDTSSSSSSSGDSESGIDDRTESQVLGQMGTRAGMHAHGHESGAHAHAHGDAQGAHGLPSSMHVHANEAYSGSSSGPSSTTLDGEPNRRATPLRDTATSRLAAAAEPTFPPQHEEDQSSFWPAAGTVPGPRDVLSIGQVPSPEAGSQQRRRSMSAEQVAPSSRAASRMSLLHRSNTVHPTISLAQGMAAGPPTFTPSPVGGLVMPGRAASTTATAAGAVAGAATAAAPDVPPAAIRQRSSSASSIDHHAHRLSGSPALIDTILGSDPGSSPHSMARMLHAATMPHGGAVAGATAAGHAQNSPRVVHLANMSGQACLAAALRQPSMGAQSMGAASLGAASSVPPVVYLIETGSAGVHEGASVASAASSRPRQHMSVAQLYGQATEAVMEALNQAGGHAGGLPPSEDDSHGARRRRTAQQRERAAAAAAVAHRQNATSRESMAAAAAAAAASFRDRDSSSDLGSSQARAAGIEAAAAAAVAAVPPTVLLPAPGSPGEGVAVTAPFTATPFTAMTGVTSLVPGAQAASVQPPSLMVTPSFPSGLPPRVPIRRSGTGASQLSASAAGGSFLRPPPLQLGSDGGSAHGGSQYGGSARGGMVYYVQVPPGLTSQAAVAAAQAAVASAQAQLSLSQAPSPASQQAPALNPATLNPATLNSATLNSAQDLELPYPLTIDGSIPVSASAPSSTSPTGQLPGPNNTVPAPTSSAANLGITAQQPQPIIVALPPSSSPRTAEELSRLVAQLSSARPDTPGVSSPPAPAPGTSGHSFPGPFEMQMEGVAASQVGQQQAGGAAPVLVAVPSQRFGAGTAAANMGSTAAGLSMYNTLMAEQHAAELPPEDVPRNRRETFGELGRDGGDNNGDDGGQDGAGGGVSPGEAEVQLQTLALFNDDEEEEERLHHVQKVFTSGHKWWKQKYWRWFMALQGVALVLFIIGIILHTQVDNSDNHANTEAFRWFYFVALMPSIWFTIDICCYYLFRWIEWYFFRESLLYLEHVQRNTITFIFVIMLLPWYNAMFVWAWCQGDDAPRCEVDVYNQAMLIQWRVLLCVVLFALANLLDSIAAKLLSLHFYRNAHFQKLQTALEKEYFLQVLSRPYRKVLAQKQAAEEAAAAAETYHKQESAGLGRAAISRFFSTFSSASRRPHFSSTSEAPSPQGQVPPQQGPAASQEQQPDSLQRNSQQLLQLHRLDKRSASAVDRASLSFKLQDQAHHMAATYQEAFNMNYNIHTTSTHGPTYLASDVEPPPIDIVETSGGVVPRSVSATHRAVVGEAAPSGWAAGSGAWAVPVTTASGLPPAPLSGAPPRRVPSPALTSVFASQSVAEAAAQGGPGLVPGTSTLDTGVAAAPAAAASRAAGATTAPTATDGTAGAAAVPSSRSGRLLRAAIEASRRGAAPAAPPVPPAPPAPPSSAPPPLPLPGFDPAAGGTERSSAGAERPTGGAERSSGPGAGTGSSRRPGDQVARGTDRGRSVDEGREGEGEHDSFGSTSFGPLSSGVHALTHIPAAAMMEVLSHSPESFGRLGFGLGVVHDHDRAGGGAAAAGAHAGDGATAMAAAAAAATAAVAGSATNAQPASTAASPEPTFAPVAPATQGAQEHRQAQGESAALSGAVPTHPSTLITAGPGSVTSPHDIAITVLPSPTSLAGSTGSTMEPGSTGAAAVQDSAGSVSRLPSANRGAQGRQYTGYPGSTLPSSQSQSQSQEWVQHAGLTGMHSAPLPAAGIAPVAGGPPAAGSSTAYQVLHGAASVPLPAARTDGSTGGTNGQPPTAQPSTPKGGEQQGRPPPLPAISESRPASVADMPRTGMFARASQDSKAVRQGGVAGSGRAAGSVRSTAERSRPSFSHPLGPMGEAIIETVPLHSKEKKDPALMTELELEKVRTAIVIKTYTAIIRNYSSMSPEQQEREMVQVRAFSRALFNNMRGDSTLPFVTLESFELFFNDKDNAMRAFSAFDTNGDGRVSRREVREAVEAIYRERANMAAALKDTDSIVKSMEFAIGGVMHFIFCAFYLLIWKVDLVQGFSAFSATLLAFTFMFGNAVKNMFESMLFLFVEHAYDVGDNILINGEIYRVKKITLLYTELVQVNGEKVFWPNAELINTVISNYTRTRTKTEYIRVPVDIGVPPTVVADIMNAMREHTNAHPTEYDGAPFVQYRDMADNLKVVLMVSWTYAFPPDDWKRLVPARNAMFGILQAKLAEHRLRYTQQEVERKVRVKNLDGVVPQ